MEIPTCEKCQQPMRKNVAKRYFCPACQKGRQISLTNPPPTLRFQEEHRGRLVTYKKRSHH